MTNRVTQNQPGDMGKRQIIHYQGGEYRSLRALASELGVDHKTLKRRMDDGLPEKEWGKQQEPLPTYTREQLQELLNKRLSYPAIAERLGTTASGIEHRVARWGLSRPPALYEQLSKKVLLEAMDQGLSKQALPAEGSKFKWPIDREMPKPSWLQ